MERICEDFLARKPDAPKASAKKLCIVMVCTDVNEADQVGKQLSELNSGCLVTYRRVEDLEFNTPAGKVALVILATSDSPVLIRRTLKWLRNHWPGCPITVIGDRGGGQQEMAAREGGACYLTRPVDPEQWTAILSHALGGARQIVTRDKA